MTGERLYRDLVARYPELESWKGRVAFAVNGAIADRCESIPADAEVALLPPVSGG